MSTKKQLLRNAFFFVLLIALTFFLVFRSYDFNETMNIILSSNKWYILLGLVVMFLSIVVEGFNVKNILNKLGVKVTLPKMIKYTLIEFFFSGITPAAGGGQPMEIYYMSRDGIKPSNTALALLLQVSSFHIVTLLLGLVGVIFNYKLLTNGYIYIFMLGFVLKAMVLSGMLILLFSKKITKVLINLFFKLLKLIHYRKFDEVKEKVDLLLADYQAGSEFIKKNRGIFLKSTLVLLVQILLYFSVTFFIYKAFNLSGICYFEIILIQAMLFVSVSSIPLPGSALISERAFLTIYERIFVMGLLPSAMILSRGITFYFFMLVSLVIVIISTIKIKRKD